VLLEVLGQQGLQQRAAGAVERPAIHQDLGDGPGLVGDPGGEGSQQVVPAYEVVLQGQDAEEQVAPGVPLWWRPGAAARVAYGAESGADGIGLLGEPESGADGIGLLGEPFEVFLAFRPLAAAPPQLPLQRHQLAQQRRAV
jgi:hypothetical protein